MMITFFKKQNSFLQFFCKTLINHPEKNGSIHQLKNLQGYWGYIKLKKEIRNISLFIDIYKITFDLRKNSKKGIFFFVFTSNEC